VKKATAIIGIVVALAIGVGVETGEIGFYNGLNKGVTVGNCGFEVVGEPGPFCGNY
jgi:hypothetical protein